MEAEERKIKQLEMLSFFPCVLQKAVMGLSRNSDWIIRSLRCGVFDWTHHLAVTQMEKWKASYLIGWIWLLAGLYCVRVVKCRKKPNVLLCLKQNFLLIVFLFSSSPFNFYMLNPISTGILRGRTVILLTHVNHSIKASFENVNLLKHCICHVYTILYEIFFWWFSFK